MKRSLVAAVVLLLASCGGKAQTSVAACDGQQGLTVLAQVERTAWLAAIGSDVFWAEVHDHGPSYMKHASISSRAVETIAETDAMISSVIADDSTVYWLDEEGTLSARGLDGETRLLASQPMPLANGRIVAQNSTTLYVEAPGPPDSDDRTVYSIDKTTGQLGVVAELKPNRLQSMAADDTFVYLAAYDENGTSVRRYSTTGASAGELMWEGRHSVFLLSTRSFLYLLPGRYYSPKPQRIIRYSKSDGAAWAFEPPGIVVGGYVAGDDDGVVLSGAWWSPYDELEDETVLFLLRGEHVSTMARGWFGPVAATSVGYFVSRARDDSSLAPTIEWMCRP